MGFRTGAGRDPWNWIVENMGLREVVALVGDVFALVSIFLPWIFGFSAPVGPSLTVAQVAAPNLIDLVLESNYPYLAAVPVGLVLGIVFTLTPHTRRKAAKVLLVGLAFALTLVAGFVFGLQFGSAYGLELNGNYSSYSIAVGTGSRVLGVGTALYFISLLITVLSE